jgi:hypothetical protein
VYAHAEASVWVGSGVRRRGVWVRLLDRAGNQQKLLSAGARFTGIVLAVLYVANYVLAQPVAPPRVQYEAIGACPTQAEFLARMQTRMGADGTRAPADISLRVTLSAQTGATHGAVEIRRGATNTRRLVDGGRCEEVADALALIAALAVRDADPARDPRARPRTRKPDKNTPARSSTQRATPGESAAASSSNGSDATPASEAGSPSNSGAARDESSLPGHGGGGVASARGDANLTRSADGQRGASDDGARGGAVDYQEKVAIRSSPQGRDNLADSVRDAPSSERSAHERNGAPSTGEASEDRGAAAESGSDAQPSVDEDPAKAARSREIASNALWRVGATAMLFSGLAPAVQPGLQLQAAVTLNAGALAWSLQIGARIARGDALASPDGDAHFGFAGGVMRLCAAHVLGSTPLTLTGCAAAEPGVFSAKGENTRNVQSHSRLWLAAGAAADLSVQLASWLSLRAGAELLAPLRRDRISLAGDTLYRVPALGFRWYLGLEVPFG